MRNETYAKFLCHNICCLISAIYELGITPVFPELATADVMLSPSQQDHEPDQSPFQSAGICCPNPADPL